MDLALPLGWYAVFLFSTVCHEAGHAWIALRGGDSTAAEGGQVSLNPWPHIRREPIGMVVLPILGLVTHGWPLGFASAPYDPQWAFGHPRRAAVMALAGPAANLIIAVVAFIGLMFVGGEPQAGQAAGELSINGPELLLKMLLYMNVVLCVLNMLPVPPLDGSSVIMLFMSESQAQRWMEFMQAPFLPIVGLVVAWQMVPLLLSPILGLVFSYL